MKRFKIFVKSDFIEGEKKYQIKGLNSFSPKEINKIIVNRDIFVKILETPKDYNHSKIVEVYSEMYKLYMELNGEKTKWDGKKIPFVPKIFITNEDIQYTVGNSTYFYIGYNSYNGIYRYEYKTDISIKFIKLYGELIHLYRERAKLIQSTCGEKEIEI